MNCEVCGQSPAQLGLCRTCWLKVPADQRAHVAKCNSTSGDLHHTTKSAIRRAIRIARGMKNHTPLTTTPRATELL